MAGQTILLVEDSPTDALIVKHGLHKRFEMDHAHSPQEAQLLLQKNAYAAVVTDYYLPGMTGGELQRWMTEQGLDVPVIVMSGRGDDRVASEALKLGAHDYIVKSEESLSTIGVAVEQALRRHELERNAQILRQIVENASDVIITLRTDGSILTANRAVQPVFGYTTEEVVGKPLTLLFPDDGPGSEVRQMLSAGGAGLSWQGELGARRKDGAVFPAHMSSSILRDRNDRVQCLIGIARDVTERRQFLERLQRLSITDNLTGLFNHRFFHERLHYEFVRARRYGNPLGCVMIDVDFFKTVNDTYGHLAGDQALKSLAAAILRATRGTDIVARYGGEEFAVLLPNTDLTGAIRCGEHVWENIGASETATPQGTIRLTVSVGVAALTSEVKDEEELCRRADSALLMAKRRGRNNVCVWEQSPASSDIPSCSIQAKDAADIQPGLCRLNAPAKAHYTESVRPMLESLCQRDPGLHRRTTDTSILVLELARGAGMDAEEVAAVQRAALFHVVASASPRPGDSAHVAGQPAATIGAGERLARQMAPFELEISYLRHQTEHYDGRGLPAGLAGNAIPLGARILAVADAYHQLISTGGGGKGMNHAEAMAELRRRAGSEFDPALVNFLVGARQKKPARPGTERRKNLP